MAIFPIHIIELFTVALVLLGAYRVVQAQSAETKSQLNLCRNETLPPPSLNKPASDEPAQNNEAQHMVETHCDQTQKKSVCHQTALNNYIGDFF